ncbi:MAG: c-type cytochrome [Alphaproteobacteria bacterium]|nr:c-type cytochrome [Alphaproteobacteria bacterium]
MKTKMIGCVLVAIGALWVLDWASAHSPGKGMVRHRYFMMNGVPEKYAKVLNPLPATNEIIAEGRALYNDNCAICHGAKGLGDGEGAEDLDPKPADLLMMTSMPMATDGFFLWSISDGGEAFETAMPAFEEILSEDERWKIIRALRAGLPD